MFSDHGMNLDENRRVPLKSSLERRGFKVTIPAFGLCSYAAVYCDEAGDSGSGACECRSAGC